MRFTTAPITTDKVSTSLPTLLIRAVMTLVMPISILALSACGTQENSPRNNAANGTATNQDNNTGENLPPAAQLVNQDEQVLGANVSAQFDDAIAGVVEDSESGGAAAFALGVTEKNDMQRFRDCVEDGNNAIITIKKSFSNEKEIDRKNLKGTNTATGLEQQTNTWSIANTALKCNAAKTAVDLPIKSRQGASMSMKIDNSFARENTLTNIKKNTTLTQKSSRTTKGDRNVSWKTVTDDGTKVTLLKELTMNVQRSFSTTNKNGETKTYESSVKNADSAPLTISLVRDSKTLEYLNRTIKSGTLIATVKDGTRIETTFENVLFEKDKRCIASSGKINGAIYAKDSTTPLVTYTVTFDGDDKDLEFSNGKTYAIDLDGCAIEQENAKVVEAKNKGDVK